MGVLTMEIEKVNKNIDAVKEEQEKRIKKVEELARKKEQEKERKQYEKDLLIACENDLRNSMNSVFESVIKDNGATDIVIQMALLQYYDMNTRQACLKEFTHTSTEYDYLNSKYNKILNEVYNNWKNHIKNAQIQEVLKQQKEQEEMQSKPIYKILLVLGIIGLVIFFLIKWGLIIAIGVCIFIFALICACANGK